MLNEEGNKFTQFYFDFENGQYINDYENNLANDLPSIFHVQDTWENYEKARKFINIRYNQWKSPQSKKLPESWSRPRRAVAAYWCQGTDPPSLMNQAHVNRLLPPPQEDEDEDMALPELENTENSRSTCWDWHSGQRISESSSVIRRNSSKWYSQFRHWYS